MSDRTAAELEHDAELARARVADTAESIRARMSPGQLIDEFTGLFQGSDGSSALSTLKSQVNQNPLALSLVGAGLAWLRLGNNSGGSASVKQASHASSSFGGMRDEAHFDAPSTKYEGRAQESSIGSRVSEAGEKLSSMAGDTMGTVKDTVSSLRDRATAAVGSTASGTSRSVDQAMGAAQDLISREPLVLAALGLAIGTAIGAMLPHTRVEDEQLGELSDKLRGQAKDALDKGLDEAKDVAAGVYGSVKNAADEQFSGDAPGSIADKVGGVLKTAASEAEQAVREKVSGAE